LTSANATVLFWAVMMFSLYKQSSHIVVELAFL
jgi:hypothetical protein